jgi:S1-C subfamily serine protease
LGTGFIVDESGLVVTARHVTQAAAGGAGSGVTVGLAQPNSENMRGNFTIVGGITLEEDRTHDLALLQMSPNPFDGGVTSGIVVNGTPIPLHYRVAHLDSTRPRDGVDVAVSGYPLRSSVLVTNAGIVASAWVVEMGPPGPGMPVFKDTYLVDVAINPGNSGGPCYRLADGAVIGVCVAYRQAPVASSAGAVAGLFQNSGLGVVVPARYVEDLVRRHLGQ